MTEHAAAPPVKVPWIRWGSVWIAFTMVLVAGALTFFWFGHRIHEERQQFERRLCVARTQAIQDTNEILLSILSQAPQSGKVLTIEAAIRDRRTPGC